MRNLNRIIFINSANIPYADDIYLDGNVHFIGTQGVGKSTVLRSILFFYNADTQKLGIPVEKQSYTEYYFPYANSYIVYEVATENGAFCILSFKSMNRVSYRFIDSPYRKEFFIDPETRTAYSGADRIRIQLDQLNVDYSRIIYTFDEYRNILYGNGVAPDMRKYSLMESKQYQNIPRTIQNVLLNSKLDAEFIKKTIISSINEDETAIDLNSYKEHLKNFEIRLQDIEEFQKRETQKQAKEITSLSVQISKQRTALAQSCRELVAAYLKAKEILPQWQEKKEHTENERGKLIGRRQELQEQSRQRCDKLQETIAVLNNELQKAQSKEKEYARQQIEQVMERSARKEEWKNRRNGLQEEQRILTSQYTEISTKYKSLIQSLDEQWNKIHEAKLKQLDELNSTYNVRIEEGRRRHETATEALYQEYEQLSQQLHPERSEKQSALTAIDYQMQLCRKEVFFEAEQEELKHRIQSYTGMHMSKKNRIDNAQLIIKEITLKWEDELQRGMKEKDDALTRLQAEQQQLKLRVDELETFLQNSRNTLQGWLKDNKPGWEENIGKLCDESILWQTGLSPQLHDNGESFYGISINLAGIDRHIKSINDYQKEKETGARRLESDIFGDFFGGGASSSGRRRGPAKGQNVVSEIEISFEDAAFGCEREITFSRIETCSTCHGSGAKEGTSPQTCSYCHGTGTVRTQQNFMGMTMQSNQPCPKCGGTGTIITDPCTACRGKGKVRHTKTVRVKVPAGIDDGQSFRVRDEGNAGSNGGPNGDLLVTVSVRKHPIFTRDGANVMCQMPISFTQAALGASIEVPTLDGKVRYQIPEGTQTGTTFRLRGKGIPYVGYKTRGDQFVTVVVETPTKLTREQKELLKQLESSVGDDGQPKRKSFFDKLKG